MEHKALSALIIRIAGLLILVYSITSAGNYLAPYVDPRATLEFEFWPAVGGFVVIVVVPVLLGLLLIWFPHSITNRILKVEGTASGADDVKPLQRVVFSAIGLWLTLFAVIDTTYFFGRSRLYWKYVGDQGPYDRAPPMPMDDFAGLVSSAVQFVIGVWLLLGSRGLVNLVARIRSPRS